MLATEVVEVMERTHVLYTQRNASWTAVHWKEHEARILYL